MIRQGRYTRRSASRSRFSRFINRRFGWFKRLSWKQKLMVIGLPILIILVVIPLITYAILARDIADPERLMNRKNTGVELLDSKGEVFYSTGVGNSSEIIGLDKISDHVEEAVVSSEDKDFYKHSGVSIRGTLGALYANFQQRDATAYGGSTLTQQLVKNKLLTADKTFFRKYQEAIMAIAVDRRYTKDEILTMYLNSAYFGDNVFGISDAAKAYFDKSAADLTLAESSMLIGVLPAPNAYSPIYGDKELGKERQQSVLRRMHEDGKITDGERQAALDKKLSYAATSATTATIAPHFAQMTIEELNNRYGEERVARSGYRVTTTMNRKWQEAAERIVADQAAINASSGGENAALVAIDPKSGGIRALVGSADYDNKDYGKVNMATSPRQPGSSFKPIYVAEAIDEREVTAATIIRDESTDFGGYKPENFDFAYRGDISVRNALAQSLNIPMVKIMEKLGVEHAVNTANKMGIETLKQDQDYGLSLALGSGEARLVDMTNAYAAFANQGDQYEKTTIEKIESKYGDVVFSRQYRSNQVQSAAASYIISDILSDNIARAPTFGGALDIPGRKVAVKTGSTDDNRDAWTIGYTPSVAVGVWVGNNDNEIMSAGGSGMAGPIWRNAITEFLGDTPNEGFARPGGVSEALICRGTEKRATSGNNAGTFSELFIDGTVPTGTCDAPKEDKPEEDDDEDEDEEQQDRDRDGDGVPDRNDDCPNTPRGVEVDERGCEIEEETDSDGDGIPDDVDECPETPANEIDLVDGVGCGPSEIDDEDTDPVPPATGGTNPTTPRR